MFVSRSVKRFCPSPSLPSKLLRLNPYIFNSTFARFTTPSLHDFVGNNKDEMLLSLVLCSTSTCTEHSILDQHVDTYLRQQAELRKINSKLWKMPVGAVPITAALCTIPRSLKRNFRVTRGQNCPGALAEKHGGGNRTHSTNMMDSRSRMQLRGRVPFSAAVSALKNSATAVSASEEISIT